MTKNIVDIYTKVIKGYKNGDFRSVVSFCEKNDTCKKDNSLKKNMLMYWSYKKIAMFYEKGKKYKKAYVFWQKAYDFALDSSLKIKAAHKMLALVDKMGLCVTGKAQEIVKISVLLHNEYERLGNKESVLRVSKLQDAAQKILANSKYVH